MHNMHISIYVNSHQLIGARFSFLLIIRRITVFTASSTHSFELACMSIHRVATVREKYLENEIFSRSGKSQGILWMAREF